MIAIINEELAEYEQDIRELLMAFFPGHTFCYEQSDEAFFTLYVKDGYIYVENGPKSDKIILTDSRRENKSIIKRHVYGVLHEMTGKELPWGTLTGIRPVKIPEKLMDEGLNDEEIRSKMQKEYYISDEKSKLILDIAHRERSVLQRADIRNGWSLYVGIPFCPTTCLYCSFTSYPIEKWSNRIEEYLNCLKKELVLLNRIHKAGAGDEYEGYISGKELQTIYIGGGTPTAISAEQLDRLLSIIEENIDLSHVVEFTVESGRPDSITEAKLEVLKKHNIDRISINPQTMNQKTLDIIGRRHTVEDVKNAYQMARKAGLNNINMDIIIGLPEENREDVKRTLDEIRRMKPDSLTVHALAVKRAARLNTEGKAWSNLERAGIDEAIQMTDDSAALAKELGLKPYYLYRQKNMAGNQENVGYAISGKENLYNILMMEELHTVIGCGAGSSSKLVIENKDASKYDGNRFRVERFENIKNIAEYLPRIDELMEKRRRFLTFSDKKDS
ncbi:MAG: coproporphyrinogen dehydrogenase HemZ [Eubacteriales bacterium]|nr:coproporphyrinogen dehydrogenase HemZ [Eubacteriales bacterium]